MKLTYWVAERLDDSSAYSVRHETRKACIAELKAIREANLSLPEYQRPAFGGLRKVTIEYASAFDLARQLLTDPGNK